MQNDSAKAHPLNYQGAAAEVALVCTGHGVAVQATDAGLPACNVQLAALQVYNRGAATLLIASQDAGETFDGNTEALRVEPGEASPVLPYQENHTVRRIRLRSAGALDFDALALAVNTVKTLDAEGGV